MREDFESRGVIVDEAFEKSIDGRFCPDIPITEEFNQVMNSYSNETLRHSFSVEIITC